MEEMKNQMAKLEDMIRQQQLQIDHQNMMQGQMQQQADAKLAEASRAVKAAIDSATEAKHEMQLMAASLKTTPPEFDEAMQKEKDMNNIKGFDYKNFIKPEQYEGKTEQLLCSQR